MRRRPRNPSSPRVLVGLVMLASGVAQGFGRFTYPLLLPAINSDLLHSYALAGLIGTANVAAYLAGTFAVALAARRAEPAALIRRGLVATCLGLDLLSVAHGPLLLAVGLACTGIGGAFIWVPAPGLSGSVVSARRRGMAIGLTGAGIGVSIVFASTLTTALQHVPGAGSWRVIWLVELGISVATLALCQLLLHVPRDELDLPAVRMDALRHVPGWLGVVGAYSAYGLSYSIFINYLVSALKEDSGFSAGHAFADYTLLGLALITGGILLGPVSDRHGRRRILIAGYLGLAAAPLLVLIGADPWVALGAVVFGTAMSGLPTVIAAHLSDHLSAHEFGAAFGSITLCFGLAQLFGPPLGGWLAQLSGSFRLPFLVAAALAALGAFSSRALPHPSATALPTSHDRKDSL